MVFTPLACSLALGASGAWFMSRYAYRFGLVDIPNDRSSHSLPTPRGGGIGILAAFIVSSLLVAVPFFVWVPAAFLALVSFFDDRLSLTPRLRLIFQFVAAFVVIGYEYAIFSSFHAQSPGLMFQNLFLVFFFCVYVVGTANFYNFMDGINGMAGITGAVGFALMGLFAFYCSDSLTLVLAASCMSLASIGFLPFNIPSARVFMGDVGSILLGFVFACYVALLARNVSDLFLLSGFMFMFYADALTTLLVRKMDGERLSQAHRRHLYQLFANQKNVIHWKISVVYGVIQSVIGLILLLLRPLGSGAIIVFEVVMILFWWMVMMRVRRAVEV